MKGLLHSKKFRSNLYKWLFMYIGVLGLLTCVITYSKYMSKMNGSDEARVSKFNITVNYTDSNCTVEKEHIICNTGNYRPLQEIAYEFSINSTEIEVKTVLVTSIYINKDFNLLGIYKKDINGVYQDVTSEFYSSTSTDGTGNSYSKTISIDADDGSIDQYEVKVKLNSESSTIQYTYSTDYTYNKVVQIGYSATQVD